VAAAEASEKDRPEKSAFATPMVAKAHPVTQAVTSFCLPTDMSQHDKRIQRLLSGAGYGNFSFADLRSLLIALGFEERVQGGHHIFSRDGVAEILNLQPRGNKAKPYQVKQVRAVVLKYDLHLRPRD